MQRPKSVDILDYVVGRRDDFIAFLEELTLAESPSVVPAVQDDVRNIIADRLAPLGFRTFPLAGKNHGGHLYARPEDRPEGGDLQLLLGHYDTVWPIGTLKNMPFSVDGNIVRGPGVYDMKG
ncbi:MAG: M20 family metallopeptidase, partial [Geminicoccaceae bacterium]